MAEPMTVTVRNTDLKMAFEAQIPNRPPLAVDYFRPVGEDQGYTSLELLLTSLATCTASGVGLLLRKQNRNVPQVNATARADRATTNPTVFTAIDLHLEVHSPDTDEATLAAVVARAESLVCPVYVMLSQVVKIRTTTSLVP